MVSEPVIEVELVPVYTLRRTDNTRKVRALYNLQFPPDTWMGRNQAHWMLSNDVDPVAGFCSAAYLKDLKCGFFTAAWVRAAVRGGGIQRRMIRTRVNWSKKQGARFCLTYCAADNYGSLYNLLRCGFQAYWKSGWHVCVLKFEDISAHTINAALKRTSWDKGS